MRRVLDLRAMALSPVGPFLEAERLVRKRSCENSEKQELELTRRQMGLMGSNREKEMPAIDDEVRECSANSPAKIEIST